MKKRNLMEGTNPDGCNVLLPTTENSINGSIIRNHMAMEFYIPSVNLPDAI